MDVWYLPTTEIESSDVPMTYPGSDSLRDVVNILRREGPTRFLNEGLYWEIGIHDGVPLGELIEVGAFRLTPVSNSSPKLTYSSNSGDKKHAAEILAISNLKDLGVELQSIQSFCEANPEALAKLSLEELDNLAEQFPGIDRAIPEFSQFYTKKFSSEVADNHDALDKYKAAPAGLTEADSHTTRRTFGR